MSTESNRLIAEFMGYEYIPFTMKTNERPSYITSGYWRKKNPKELFINKSEFYRWNPKLSYDTSWEEISKVIERIESISICPTVTIWPRKGGCTIEVAGEMLDEGQEDFYVSVKSDSLSRHGKLESIYKAIVIFITWFNKVKSDYKIEIPEPKFIFRNSDQNNEHE